MRVILTAAMVAASLLLVSETSRATGFACEIRQCASSVTVDGGATNWNCSGTAAYCSGEGGMYIQWCDYYWSTTTSCASGYSYRNKQHIDGKYLCAESWSCSLPPQVNGESISSSEEVELAHVFGPELFNTVHFGWVNSSNRSPNAGRGNSGQAKLDACLSYTNVDSLGTGLTGYNNCIGNSGCLDTNKNAHCQANNATICVDRCECHFGYGTCDGY